MLHMRNTQTRTGSFRRSPSERSYWVCICNWYPSYKYDFTRIASTKETWKLLECNALSNIMVTQCPSKKDSCFTPSLYWNSYTSNFLHSERTRKRLHGTVINCKILGRIIIQIYAMQYLFICIFCLKRNINFLLYSTFLYNRFTRVFEKYYIARKFT